MEKKLFNGDTIEYMFNVVHNNSTVGTVHGVWGYYPGKLKITYVEGDVERAIAIFTVVHLFETGLLPRLGQSVVETLT